MSKDANRVIFISKFLGEQKEKEAENPRVKLFEDDSVKSLGEMFTRISLSIYLDPQDTITHNQHSNSPSRHKIPHKLFYKEEIAK